MAKSWRVMKTASSSSFCAVTAVTAVLRFGIICNRAVAKHLTFFPGFWDIPHLDKTIPPRYSPLHNVGQTWLDPTAAKLIKMPTVSKVSQQLVQPTVVTIMSYLNATKGFVRWAKIIPPYPESARLMSLESSVNSVNSLASLAGRGGEW